MKNKTQKDWAGIKFEIMKDFGECIDIVFIKKDNINSPKESDKFYIIPHSKADGISAILTLLEQVFGLKNTSVPVVKKVKKPFLLRRLFLAYKHLKRQAPQNYALKQFTSIKKGNPSGLGYFIFSNEQTQKIQNFCLENKISLNALLLNALDQVTCKEVLDKHQKRVWMVPVNIRDEDHKRYRLGNHVTTLSIHLAKDSDSSAKSINQQMRDQLKSGIIWGGKIIANSPKFIGEKRLRKIGANVKSPYIGLCSNIGSWPNLYDDLQDKNTLTEHIIVSPPATSFCPVALAIMTWNECLTLSLQLHPSLINDLTKTSDYLEKIISEVLWACKVSKDAHQKVMAHNWQDLQAQAVHLKV